MVPEILIEFLCLINQWVDRYSNSRLGNWNSYTRLKSKKLILSLGTSNGTLEWFSFSFPHVADVSRLQLKCSSLSEKRKNSSWYSRPETIESHVFLNFKFLSYNSADPNRPGMHMKLIKYLLKLKAPRIVYVSCNPATLARDLDYLCHGVVCIFNLFFWF